MMHRSHQVTATAEAGADEFMHGQASLCLPGRVALAQVSRAVPCGLVGDVGTMVRVSGPCAGRRTAGPLGVQPGRCAACR